MEARLRGAQPRASSTSDDDDEDEEDEEEEEEEEEDNGEDDDDAHPLSCTTNSQQAAGSLTSVPAGRAHKCTSPASALYLETGRTVRATQILESRHSLNYLWVPHTYRLASINPFAC